jgi:hypothetical protein
MFTKEWKGNGERVYVEVLVVEGLGREEGERTKRTLSWILRRRTDLPYWSNFRSMFDLGTQIKQEVYVRRNQEEKLEDTLSFCAVVVAGSRPMAFSWF